MHRQYFLISLRSFFGFSILNVPELHWNPYHTAQAQWFNVRYGVLALPLASVLVGYFAGWKKMAAVIVFEILIFQMYLFTTNGIVTVIDGTVGSSSFQNGAVAQVLKSDVKPNETVLMSLSAFNPVAFKSGLDLKQIINDGDGKIWNNALSNPAQYADWVVVGGDANSGDPVRKAITANSTFSTQYKKVFSNNEATIYELKDTRALVFHLQK